MSSTDGEATITWSPVSTKPVCVCVCDWILTSFVSFFFFLIMWKLHILFHLSSTDNLHNQHSHKVGSFRLVSQIQCLTEREILSQRPLLLWCWLVFVEKSFFCCCLFVFIQADNWFFFFFFCHNQPFLPRLMTKKVCSIDWIDFFFLTLVLTCDNIKSNKDIFWAEWTLGKFVEEKKKKTIKKQTHTKKGTGDRRMMYRRTGNTKAFRVRPVRQTRLLLSCLFYCSAQ